MSLLFQKLKNDTRVKRAKKLLKEALLAAQKSIRAVSPADPKRKMAYAECIQRYSEKTGRNLYFPYFTSGLGRGALVQLADGSVKYDFISGIGVHYLGHSHPKILEALIDASLEDTVMQGNLIQSPIAVEIMDTFLSLARRKGASLKHCFLSSSGAMANENALKIIFHKQTPAPRLLAFKNCFAGRTLVMSQVTDNPENKEGLPKVIDVDYIPFFDLKRPGESAQEAVGTLKRCLQEHPGQYAGMIFELIQGEGGFYAGEREFFVSLMKILKENKIAVMVDEIQTFGRTSEPFAFQYFGLDEWVDVVTIGKLTHVCATLYREEYKPKQQIISQTFTAGTSAFYTAKVMLDVLLKKGLLGKNGRIMKLSEYFVLRLKDISSRHNGVLKGPYGLGAMIGCSVFDGSAEKSKIFLQELFEAGVVAFVAGRSPVRVRFLMPMGAVTVKDIDTVSKIIEKTLVKMRYHP